MLKYLLIVAFVFCYSNCFSQKQYNVLDWKTDVTLNTWLLQEMKAQYAKRQEKLSKALTSKKLTQDYITGLQRTIPALLVPVKGRSPLNGKVTGTIQKEGYRIEKILYESFPDHHVTSNLYIPEGKGKFPAALLLCGHEDAAKATPSYQQTAILLAKNGFVVLVVDPVSQGERMQLTDKAGKPLTRGGTTEHTLLNQAANLLGTSLPGYELYDNIRSLDYLVTRHEVDTSKIGCLGNSGGAIQTIYFAGVDKRVKAFAVCSYLATRERTFELSGAADGCAQVPNEGAMGLEMNDYLIAAAPKPVLVLAGRYDFIDYTGTLDAYKELKKVYNILGEPQKVDLFTYDDGHGISKPKREAAVRWFRKWFYNDDKKVYEANNETLSEKELRVTNNGQVNSEFTNELDLNKYFIQLYKTMMVDSTTVLLPNTKVLKNELQRLFALQYVQKTLDFEQKEQVGKSDFYFQKMIVRKEGEIPLPLLIHSASSAKKIILWLHDGGKQRIADSTKLLQQYKNENITVVLADVRGVGETKDKPEENDPKFYNQEYRNAMLALHIGKPLVGQRVNDILTILDALSLNKGTFNLPIEIHASGHLTLAALLAAYLNPKIETVHLYNSIKSFKEILENPTAKNWYSYVIPGILQQFDIPDIEKLIGTGRIIRHD